MIIVNIINSILEAMVQDENCPLQSWQYNDLGTANVRLDSKKPSPTAVFLQISDWTLAPNAINIKESAQINISFLEKESKLDAGGLEQDQIIDRMKALAVNFYLRLRNVKKLQIEEDEVVFKSVYLRSDSNRSGVNLQLTVRERQGECICDGTYNPVFTVTENGTYTVAGYTQVVVQLPDCPECPDPPVPPDLGYLCFTALEDNSSVTTIKHTGIGPVEAYWSRDKVNWTEIDNEPIQLQHTGDKVYFYGENSNRSRINMHFSGTGKLAVSGDATTLLTREGNVSSIESTRGCFQGLFHDITALVSAEDLVLPSITLGRQAYEVMFEGCTSLTKAPKLPAETVPYCGYQEMFSGCTSLTEAPELLAETIGEYCYKDMFNGCTSLVTPPSVLPAKTLNWAVYQGMFSGCTSLTTAPELPATSMHIWCYQDMFNGCTSLTTAPELPATGLASYCYYQMFLGCTSLTTAPATLPATTLGNDCYSKMFWGCTSLTTAPALPATTLANRCYYCMFFGCHSLTTAPATLPATTLAIECYRGMFQSCTSLTAAPALPATTMADGCYTGMFWNCTSLNYIKVGATSWDTSYSGDWVFRVARTGTFEKLSTLTDIPTGSSGIPNGWTVVDYDIIDYLCFTANEANSTVSMMNERPHPTLKLPTIYVSTDNKATWTQWDYSAITLSNIGDKVYMYGSNPEGFGWTDVDYSTFQMTGSISASGDVTTLLNQYGVMSLPNGCFYKLFYGCTSLTTAPSLPATTMAFQCYRDMFYGCTSLTTAPELPATTLAASCYFCMFQDCTSLTTPPALPATTLADQCYAHMFRGCTSLTNAPELPVETLPLGCYYDMFSGCTSLNSITCLATDISAEICTASWLLNVAPNGTFTKNASMNDWPTGRSGIPSGWTVVDYQG